MSQPALEQISKNIRSFVDYWNKDEEVAGEAERSQCCAVFFDWRKELSLGQRMDWISRIQKPGIIV